MSKLNRIQKLAIAGAMALALAVPVVMAQTPTPTADVPAGGHHGHFGRHGGRGGFGMMGFSKLNLTDAQKAQLKQIHQTHSQTIAPLMAQMKAKRQEIGQAGTDEAAITQKLTELAPLQAKLTAEHARIRQESLAVLTTEQKAQLDQMREQAKAKWTERQAERQANRATKQNQTQQ